MARVLIAGCGYVGTALGELLAAHGHRVWGLRRHPQGLPDGIRPVAADLLEPTSLTALPAGLGFVFYTAAAAGRSDEAYRAAYVTGLSNLLAALADQGQEPRRIFFTSSTAVYAQSGGEWVDETSPTEPRHFSGRRLLEAEAVLARGPYPGTVVRLGGIYGPGRTGLVESVRRGEAVCYEGPPVFTNRIHRDDCAGALGHLMGLGRPADLILGVDSEPAERCQVLRWLADRLGVEPPPVGPAPVAVGGEEAGRSLRSNKRCSNRRLLATGYALRYPTYREGYGALVEAYSPPPPP